MMKESVIKNYIKNILHPTIKKISVS